MNVLSRTLAPLVLLVACFGLSSCYTQLGAAETNRSDRYRVPAATAASTAQPATEAPAVTGQTAHVGVDYTLEEPVYDGEAAYQDALADGVYRSEYEDDVQVTRYHYDESYYDSYDYYGSDYGGYVPYYDAYAPYYYPHRWQWYYLYSPYYPAPRWAYGFDPFFDLHYRHGWGWSFGITFGSPYYYRPYYSPFYHDPFYSPYYYGYGPSYASYNHGYYHGYYDGYYAGGGYYGSGHYGGGIRNNGPRGSIRSALGGERTRRRALMAYADDRTDRVLLDSPLGIRSVTALANDTRQHVLAQSESVRAPVRAEPSTRTRDRVTDLPVRAEPSVRTDTPVRDLPTRAGEATTRTPETRVPSTRAPETRTPSTRAPETRAPQTRTPRAEEAPERRLGRPSRWSAPASPPNAAKATPTP